MFHGRGDILKLHLKHHELFIQLANLLDCLAQLIDRCPAHAGDYPLNSKKITSVLLATKQDLIWLQENFKIVPADKKHVTLRYAG